MMGSQFAAAREQAAGYEPQTRPTLARWRWLSTIRTDARVSVRLAIEDQADWLGYD